MRRQAPLFLIALVCALSLASLRAEAQRKQSWAAAQRAYTREMFTALAGSPPMKRGALNAALRAVPLRNGKPGMTVFSEETPDRGRVQHKLVRTGTTSRGQPRGYVRSTWTDQQSGEHVVRVDGTGTSWVRRGDGNNRVALAARNRNLRGKDGTTRLPAGTRITITSEELGEDLRTTVRHDTLLGESKQRTMTASASGRAERYVMLRNRDGRLMEQRVRWTPDGSWRGLEQTFDGETLRTREIDARGHVKERALERAQAEQLLAKVREGEDKAGESLREYAGRGWLWRKQTYGHEGLGTVRARGRGGELGAVVSGFVSPLGTRFGEVQQVHRPFGATRARGSRPGRVWSQRLSDPPPPDPVGPENPPLEEITMADRVKVEMSAQHLNRAVGNRGIPFKMVIHPEENEINAFALPADDRFEAHISGRLAKHGSMAALVGIGAHEIGHEVDPKIRIARDRINSLEARATTLQIAGAYTEATAAILQGADIHRSKERFADKMSGKLTARARNITKDPSMTPAAPLRLLMQSQLTPWQWTPADGYDSLEERGRAMWQGYHQELKLQRLSSAARRGAAVAVREARLKAHAEAGERRPTKP